MSLDGFYRALGALAADPEIVRRSRAGRRDWLEDFPLTALESRRVEAMAKDRRMEVICSLYRSNRLAALVRTVPEVVEALGGRLSDEVSEFWRATPRTDMQFRTEGSAFCQFVRDRHGGDAALGDAIDTAEAALADAYEG